MKAIKKSLFVNKLLAFIDPLRAAMDFQNKCCYISTSKAEDGLPASILIGKLRRTALPTKFRLIKI